MRKLVIINIRFNTPMNTYVEVPRLTKEWIDYRMDIFMNYTCKSLINQTNQSFIGIVRYDELSHNLIEEALSRYPKLPDNIVFTPSPNRIINKALKNYDYLYLNRIDCDDMYHPTFVQQLIDFPFYEGLECILNQHGYIYDSVNNRLGTWFHKSPPFYTLIYKSEDYLNKKYYKLNRGHTGAILLNHEIINNKNFIVNVHEKNTMTKFEKSHTKEVILDENLKTSILKEFKII